MSNQFLHKSLTLAIAMVWLVNGLCCKVLNLVPRHQQIVGEILGDDYSGILTKAIGFAEIFVAIWVFLGIKSRYCALFQIIIIASMNILEFTLVPNLLLWGRFNIVFATLLILVILYNEFSLKKKLQ